MYFVYFGEISIHRFQHKAVNHIYAYIYIYIFARLPLFFGTFTSPYLFGKRSQAFLPELPCALAAIQQIPVGQVNDDLDVFTSFWTGQYVETWIASANLFFVDYSACNPVSQFWKDDPCSVSCRWKIEPIQ